MVPAATALERLKEGNSRYVQELSERVNLTGSENRRELVNGQQPFAIILGCSDSRVPAEIVFDQGLGDLFVIRVAGNIVAPSLVGSVEYAAEALGTRLVVVMGHTQCGAVGTTIRELQQPTDVRSSNLQSIVNRIRPAVEPLLLTSLNDDEQGLYSAAIRANVQASVNHLRHGSEILERLEENDGLQIVGAEYSIETGKVEFLD